MNLTNTSEVDPEEESTSTDNQDEQPLSETAPEAEVQGDTEIDTPDSDENDDDK